MASSSKVKPQKPKISNDKKIYDHKENLFDTLMTSFDLHKIILESKSNVVARQDPFHLWETSLDRTICPQAVHFCEFINWHSTHYSSNKRVILSLDQSKPPCIKSIYALTKILCFPKHYKPWMIYLYACHTKT